MCYLNVDPMMIRCLITRQRGCFVQFLLVQDCESLFLTKSAKATDEASFRHSAVDD